GRAGAGGADIGVADVLATGALGRGLPQSTPSRRSGSADLAPEAVPGSAGRETPVTPALLVRVAPALVCAVPDASLCTFRQREDGAPDVFRQPRPGVDQAG